jgi:hypothetical protein
LGAERHRDRSEELADVLYDSDEDPFSRFLACLALTRWADGAGYDAVGDSDDMVEERGTGTERLQAVRALLAIADRVQFDRHIGALLRRDLVVDSLPDDIRAAVDRGIVRLAKKQLSYDLGLQLALMIAAAKWR